MSSPNYKTIRGYGQAGLDISKSQFIAFADQVETEEQALRFISSIKQHHPAANHHCTAYITGRHDQHQRADDDGEPSGTAGKPILEVIKKHQLKNTAIVVVRYFGGIKLGTGGLIRAYGKAAGAAIEAAGITEKSLHCRMAIDLSYVLLGKIENFINTHALPVENKEFSDTVRIIALFPKNRRGDIMKTLTELTAGQAGFTLLDEVYRDFTPDP